MEIVMMRASPKLQSRFGLRRVYAMGCGIYALGFLLWGLIDNPAVVSGLTIFEGMAFSLLFTSGVVMIGRLVPPSLYSTGNSVAQMVAFGLGPILGAGLGGLVYQHAGPVVLYTGASVLALAGAAVAWFALRGQQLDRAPLPSEDPPADPASAPLEPLG